MTRPAIHPGEHLAEELRELTMSASELARRLDVPPNRITGILNGRRAVTGDTALRLGHFFGTSAAFWLNLQSIFELRLAESRTGKKIKALPTLKQGSVKPMGLKRVVPAGLASEPPAICRRRPSRSAGCSKGER